MPDFAWNAGLFGAALAVKERLCGSVPSMIEQEKSTVFHRTKPQAIDMLSIMNGYDAFSLGRPQGKLPSHRSDGPSSQIRLSSCIMALRKKHSGFSQMERRESTSTRQDRAWALPVTSFSGFWTRMLRQRQAFLRHLKI